MRRALLIAAVAVLALTFAASAQGAATVPTKVDIELFTPDSGKLFAVGTLSAGDQRCVPNRTVEIQLVAPNKAPVSVDTARTADHGGWMGFRSVAGIPQLQFTEVKLVVPKKVVKLSKTKDLTCAGKTRSFALAG